MTININPDTAIVKLDLTTFIKLAEARIYYLEEIIQIPQSTELSEYKSKIKEAREIRDKLDKKLEEIVKRKRNGRCPNCNNILTKSEDSIGEYTCLYGCTLRTFYQR